MGMAASQARYLALTARKTNTEWEGQQINQARTALANQSANLFNQLLGMEVPNPPKETDYVETQYSYSDGANDSVIEEWTQIGNNNPDYNYVVKHYYMAEIFTGAMKQLQDPQVQKGDVLKRLDYSFSDPKVELDSLGNITVKYKVQNVDQEQKYDKITKQQVEDDAELKAALTNFETAMNMAKTDGTLNTDAVYGYQDTDGTWHFFVANDYEKINASQVDADDDLREALIAYEERNNLLDEKGNYTIENIFGKIDSEGKWNFTTDAYNHITASQADADEELKEALIEFENNNYLINEDGTINYDNIYGYKIDGDWQFYYNKDTQAITPDMTDEDETLEAALRAFEESREIIGVGDDLDYDGVRGFYNGKDWHFLIETEDTLNQVNIIQAKDNIDYYYAYGPSYVGNSKLTELNKLIVNDKIDQVADLAQILKDCPDSNINKYVSFDASGNLIYTGNGIYTFDLNGQSYYTTEQDLNDSYVSPYIPDKPIDNQKIRLNYYNASSISKKIEETNKALLETDGNGRFTSVKYDNDSNIYQLNFEQVKDDAAYNDAMNAYLHKKAQYEKTIADINAKTSIIQKEDRTLELRLKQLDTEQNALATEMDAVKKVIKDNVEKTFKTFSD